VSRRKTFEFHAPNQRLDVVTHESFVAHVGRAPHSVAHRDVEPTIEVLAEGTIPCIEDQPAVPVGGGLP
jgi:hypothetical protein